MSTKKKIITVVIVEAIIIAAVIVLLFYINSHTVRANQPTNQDEVCLGEVKDDAWKQAYIDIIRNWESKETEDYTYDLIYFDDNDIPELLVDADGYYLSLYTYADDKIYEIMKEAGYGLWGRSYDYFERKSLIGSFVYYFDNDAKIHCYDIEKVNEDYEFTDCLSMEADIDSDRGSFSYNDYGSKCRMEITEEAYNSYLQNEFHVSSINSAIEMSGSKDADEMIQEILLY